MTSLFPSFHSNWRNLHQCGSNFLKPFRLQLTNSQSFISVIIPNISLFSVYCGFRVSYEHAWVFSFLSVLHKHDNRIKITALCWVLPPPSCCIFCISLFFPAKYSWESWWYCFAFPPGSTGSGALSALCHLFISHILGRAWGGPYGHN